MGHLSYSRPTYTETNKQTNKQTPQQMNKQTNKKKQLFKGILLYTRAI